MPEPTLDEEDAKLVTLARTARARTGATEAAAVRDQTGRTYVATTVALPSLALSALEAAVAAAVSSGVRTLEAAFVVGDEPSLRPRDAAVAADLGVEQVLLADPSGRLRSPGTPGSLIGR